MKIIIVFSVLYFLFSVIWYNEKNGGLKTFMNDPEVNQEKLQKFSTYIAPPVVSGVIMVVIILVEILF